LRITRQQSRSQQSAEQQASVPIEDITVEQVVSLTEANHLLVRRVHQMESSTTEILAIVRSLHGGTIKRNKNHCKTTTLSYITLLLSRSLGCAQEVLGEQLCRALQGNSHAYRSGCAPPGHPLAHPKLLSCSRRVGHHFPSRRQSGGLPKRHQLMRRSSQEVSKAFCPFN
jgi:hypothetical protein